MYEQQSQEGEGRKLERLSAFAGANGRSQQPRMECPFLLGDVLRAEGSPRRVGVPCRGIMP